VKLNPKEKIACGVAGVGYLGQHHARIYNELESSNLVGFYEPSDDAAQKIEEAYGCRRFENLAELGQACDAVSVVCPTDQHAEVAMPPTRTGLSFIGGKAPLYFKFGSGRNSTDRQ
jgi:predicted dehydrogenase